MKELRFLNSKEIKEMLGILEEQFGYKEKNMHAWVISSKNNVYIVNREIDNISLDSLRVDSIGLYIGEYKEGSLRLSLEGSMIIGSKAKKNILEINKEERNKWMTGEDLAKDLGEESRFLILKNNNDFLGCGRYKERIIHNYVPKERRLRTVAN